MVFFKLIGVHGGVKYFGGPAAPILQSLYHAGPSEGLKIRVCQ